MEEPVAPGTFGRSAYNDEGELKGCLNRADGLMGLGPVPPPRTLLFSSKLLGLCFC